MPDRIDWTRLAQQWRADYPALEVFTYRQIDLIAPLAEGLSVEEAARVAGMLPATARKQLVDAKLREQIAQVQSRRTNDE